MSRGREYTFKPIEGFRSKEVASIAAMLVEAAERLYDVLSYVDDEKLHYIPDGSYLSVARLVKHMAWGEAQWIEKLCGKEVPPKLLELFGNPTPGRLRDLTEGDETADELSKAIRLMRADYSIPALSNMDDIDESFETERGPDTIRQVLSHLIWHWTYHSGQVGITLLQAGFDYEWTFA